MDNQELIMGVEDFKFTTFSPVPKPDKDTAYILYREGNETEHCMIITPRHPALSKDVKAGHYDKKMTVSLAPRKMYIKAQVKDAQGSYSFLISIELTYQIKDLAYVFENALWNMDAAIKSQGMELIDSIHKKYEIEDQIDLQSALRVKMSNQMAEKNFLNIMDLNVSVSVDERAEKVLDSTLDALADTVVMQNEGDKLTAELEQKTRLEIVQLEAEKELERRRSEVMKEKAKGMKQLRDELGEDYTIFLAYAEGEISSSEYDEKMRSHQKNKIAGSIETIQKLADSDALPGPVLEQLAKNLLGVSSPEDIAVPERIGTDAGAVEKIVVAEAEEL